MGWVKRQCGFIQGNAGDMDGGIGNGNFASVRERTIIGHDGNRRGSCLFGGDETRIGNGCDTRIAAIPNHVLVGGIRWGDDCR